jgi:N-acyl-D-aspartate/D-glutamate deacylase
MSYDLKIVGGTIIDGSGSTGYPGDIAIKDGRIVAVGVAPEDATRVIDATGRVVSPGFIDPHTHYDAQIVWDPMLSHSPWHGVTTVVMGNCGIGFAPCREEDRDYMMQLCALVEGIPYECLKEGMGDWGFSTYPEYLDFIERRGIAINVISQIAHHPIKVWVQGSDATARFANAEEMRQQREVLREALRSGAAGFSIYNGPGHWGPGSRTVPSRLTTPDQFESMVAVLAEEGTGGLDLNWGSVFNPKTIPALWERYHVPFNRPQTNSAKYHDRNEAAIEANRNGVAWHPQIGALPNSFEIGLEDPFMFAIDQPLGSQRGHPLHDLFGPLTEQSVAQRLETYKRADFRAEFVRETDQDDWNTRYWPLLRVSYSPSRREPEGRFLVDLAKEAGVTPAEIMLDLAIESDLHARFTIENPQDEDNVLRMLTDEGNTFLLGASDAGAHQGQIADYRYPTHILSHYVRDKGLPIERAVACMTGLVAEAYGIIDRGLLREGYAADVVVFDPDTVKDGPLERVNDLPGGARRLFSAGLGIDHVIVNGEPLFESGERVGDPEQYHGRLLREFRSHAERAERAAAQVV